MKLEHWNDRTHRVTKTKLEAGHKPRSTLTNPVTISERILLTAGLYWVILDTNEQVVFGPVASVEDAHLLDEFINWRRNK